MRASRVRVYGVYDHTLDTTCTVPYGMYRTVWVDFMIA